MKKLVTIAILAAAATSAMAVDMTLRGTRSVHADNTSFGVAVGKKFGKFGAEAGFDRTTLGTENMNKWSVVGSYDVAQFGPVSTTVKAGAALLDTDTVKNSGAMLVGVGAAYPLTKNVSLVADYFYQKGQTRISRLDGNYFSGGVKVAF